MTHEFKIGDTVRCINPKNALCIGGRFDTTIDFSDSHQVAIITHIKENFIFIKMTGCWYN